MQQARDEGKGKGGGGEGGGEWVKNDGRNQNKTNEHVLFRASPGLAEP